MSKKIVLNIENRCYNNNDFRNAVIKQLEEKGHVCQSIDSTTLLIDLKKYSLSEWNLSTGAAPLQQAILKELES